METRRIFLKKWLGATFLGLILPLVKLLSISWAEAKKLLPKGFSKDEIIQMHPADIDNRDLEVDPLDKFGTMGPTDIRVDPKTYRLKVSGKVDKPLLLTLDQIRQYPSLTEVVLLICPGVFVNNGRWTGVGLKTVLQEARVKQGAKFVDIRGAQEKVVKIPVEELYKKKIFLAYQVNGETIPQKHGFPLRLVLEDHYGYEWVKYAEEIEVS